MGLAQPAQKSSKSRISIPQSSGYVPASVRPRGGQCPQVAPDGGRLRLCATSGTCRFLRVSRTPSSCSRLDPARRDAPIWLTEAFPKGLLIGTVLSVGEEFSGLSRYAAVKPAVNLNNLEEVLVVAQ